MYDIIVVGGGTAGMTAALNALRGGKSVLVIECETIGGQIAFSPRVENLPSITQISGAEFANNLFEQITALGADFEADNVTGISFENNVFTVKCDYASFEAKAVILAVGVVHRTLNVPREEDLIGKGVSYCALCDGAFYAGQEVALIGDANTALQYALLLANYCSKVKVFTLFDKFFADKVLVDRLKERSNVEITHCVSLIEYVGEPELSGLIFKRTTDGTTFETSAKACFIAIGQIPKNDVFAKTVKLDKDGYIIGDENMATSAKGIFVAGDCRAKKIRQLTTAANDGAIAAWSAMRYIDEL